MELRNRGGKTELCNENENEREREEGKRQRTGRG